MGCGSSISNTTGLVETPNPGDTKTKQDSLSPISKASPKPTLMKADKFLSREEARERRQKALEEKQIRSKNNAQAISAQAMVDQERLSTSTRRSVRSFASSSTATPLKTTEASTQATRLSEIPLQEGTRDPENVQSTAAVMEGDGQQAPQVIVEESKNVISSEDEEGKFVSSVRHKELEESKETGGDGEDGENSGIICSDDAKEMETTKTNIELESESRGRVELGSENIGREELGTEDRGREELGTEDRGQDELGKSVEESTVENVNLNQIESLESEEQSTQSHPENEKVDHADRPVDTDENSLEIARNSTETDEPGTGQRSNHDNHETDQEASDNRGAPANQDVDEGTIMDHDIGERVKVQEREGVQGEAWDGSDEGVADLDDGDNDMQNEVQGGAN